MFSTGVWRTDGRTDRRTDGPTDKPSYRYARTHLKIRLFLKYQVYKGHERSLYDTKDMKDLLWVSWLRKQLPTGKIRREQRQRTQSIQKRGFSEWFIAVMIVLPLTPFCRNTNLVERPVWNAVVLQMSFGWYLLTTIGKWVWKDLVFFLILRVEI